MSVDLITGCRHSVGHIRIYRQSVGQDYKVFENPLMNLQETVESAIKCSLELKLADLTVARET
jgi:hypothetical protein